MLGEVAMYIPLRRSIALILAVVGVLGPLSTWGQAQVAIPSALNPYVNPIAGQGFGFANGVGFATPLAGLAGFGLGLNQGARFGGFNGMGYGNLAAHNRMGYGNMMYGGMGGYGLSGGLANNLLSGAAWGFGLGYGQSLGNTQWMMNPYQGYLQGASDITRAQADYWKGIQQAKLTRQEAIRSSIETRRAMIEEAEWERAHQPDPEKIRQAALEGELNRARVSPPLNDVWSARSLNALLRHVSTQQADGVKGPRVPLSKDILDHVNVTAGDTVGNIGLIKKGADLDWPEALLEGTFKDERERMNSLLQTAYKAVSSGNNPDNPTLNDLQDQYRKLRQTLENHVADLKPGDYIEAKKFVKELGNAVTALKDPNVGHQFNDDWKPKADDVAGLVKHMREKGLRFAPATEKDLAAYQVLYNALATFDAGMARFAINSNNGDNK
jgi:hypothetical protein